MMNVVPLNLARAARLERQTETEIVPEATIDVPAAEQQRSADRRGPLRPGRLVSARARISGYATARLFRITDVGLIFACAMLVRPWEAAAGWAAAATIVLAVTLVILAGLNILRAYDFNRHEGLAFHLARLAAAVVVAGAMTGVGLLFIRDNAKLWEAIGIWLCLSLIGLYALHTAWFLVVRRWRNEGRLTPNIVVLGATEGVGRLIASALESREVAVLGIFDDRAARAPAQIQGVPVLGDTQALLTHRVLPYVDRIVIGVPASAQTRVRQLIERLEMLPNEIALLLDGNSAEADAAYGRIADLPLAHVAGVQTDEARAFAKRVVDVAVGVAALMAAAPVMAAVALAVKLESPGPALFRQRRTGLVAAGARHVARGFRLVEPGGWRKSACFQFPHPLVGPLGLHRLGLGQAHGRFGFAGTALIIGLPDAQQGLTFADAVADAHEHAVHRPFYQRGHVARLHRSNRARCAHR